MDKTSYRALAPRVGRHVPARIPQESRKRKRSTIACNACRDRKTGCDSVRPVCAACQTRGSACEYITKDDKETRSMALRRENINLRECNAALEELVNYLRFLPEDSAQKILRTLRATSDPLAVVQHINDTVPDAKDFRSTYSGRKTDVAAVESPGASSDVSQATVSSDSTIDMSGDVFLFYEFTEGVV